MYALRVVDTGIHADFTQLNHTSDLKIGTTVATLPGAWLYRISAGTGLFSVTEPGIANAKKKKKKRKFLRVSRDPLKMLKVETKTCAIWGILESNLKKSNTLKFMTNISFVPSVCIHRSIILIFIEKEVCLSIFFHGKYIFPWFDFHFRENPRFWDEFQALVSVYCERASLICNFYLSAAAQRSVSAGRSHRFVAGTCSATHRFLTLHCTTVPFIDFKFCNHIMHVQRQIWVTFCIKCFFLTICHEVLLPLTGCKTPNTWSERCHRDS